MAWTSRAGSHMLASSSMPACIRTQRAGTHSSLLHLSQYSRIYHRQNIPQAVNAVPSRKSLFLYPEEDGSRDAAQFEQQSDLPHRSAAESMQELVQGDMSVKLPYKQRKAIMQQERAVRRRAAMQLRRQAYQIARDAGVFRKNAEKQAREFYAEIMEGRNGQHLTIRDFHPKVPRPKLAPEQPKQPKRARPTVKPPAATAADRAVGDTDSDDERPEDDIDDESAAAGGEAAAELTPQERHMLNARYAKARDALGMKRFRELFLLARNLPSANVIKIGARGVSRQLIEQVAMRYRNSELIKLRIHDTRTSRNRNIPRLNELYKELEDLSGGMLIYATGAAIVMYRGPNYVKPPVEPPKVWVPSPFLSELHQPAGSWEEMEGVRVYKTGDAPPGTPAIVAMYDMFGLQSTQVLKTCDLLAHALGCHVYMPDSLGKEGVWPLSRYPPKKNEKNPFNKWLEQYGGLEKPRQHVSAIMRAATARYGTQRFAVVGFCWGASVALRAGSSSYELPGKVAAVACVSPSWFGGELTWAPQLEVPAAVIAAKHDPMEKLQLVTNEHDELSETCVYKRFGKVPHAFCSAYGDWKDPKVTATITEAMDIVTRFLKEHLLEQEPAMGDDVQQ